jgi:ATP-binding cassette subfamily F protein 3
LEEALRSYEGTLVFVSHDRYFLDRLARRVVVCERDGWKCYQGNYSDYVDFARQRLLEMGQGSDAPRSGRGSARAETATGSDAAKSTRRKRRFPYRKTEEIEHEIAEKEAAMRQLQTQMADPQIHRAPDRIREVTRQHDRLSAELTRLYEHWEEASELN